MKNVKIYFLLVFLIIILIYVTNITSFPERIILFDGEEINFNTVAFLNLEMQEKISDEVVQTSGTIQNEEVNTGKISLNLFGKIPVKEVSVSVIPKTKVVPVGSNIGLKLYTNGVLVVGMTEIESQKPYEKSGIEEGDMIVQVNENEITCTADLIQVVNNSGGENINLRYIRDGILHETSILPVETADNEYKIGLWVRDAAAGVGTLTYYEPSTKGFAALGHGILDVDTGELVSIANGEVVTTDIISIQKGEPGIPGEIKGSIANQSKIGDIYKNTYLGIYGTLDNPGVLNINNSEAIDVALRDEIQTGKAYIICSLENNVREKYEIEIERVYKNNNENNKSMVIKVTDQDLIEKTGGIIQRNEWFTYNSKW